MEKEHLPVLLNEAIQYLEIKPNGIYVDCTLGRAGHAQAILKKITGPGRLYAIDQDPDAIQKSTKTLSQISDKYEILKGNFGNIAALLALKNVFAVDGILYDLGVSSPQFDVATRGFSYRFDGPLDMRMDPSNELTAAEVVNTQTVEELSRIFKEYGEEKYAKSIAEAIVASRPLDSTFQLVTAIKKGLPQKVLKQKGHPAKKVFQALRIYVNDEINVFQSSLDQSLKLLKPKGRIVVISFHSLEEKIVKQTFKKVTENLDDQVFQKLPLNLPPTTKFKLVIKKPIKASGEEINQNPRSHSAKMWVLEKR